MPPRRRKPPPTPDPDVLPDSLPRHGEEPDVLPDGPPRREPDTTPDSLPPQGDSRLTATRPEGGDGQHPVHADQADVLPEDYEEQIADAPPFGLEARCDEAEEIAHAGDAVDVEELGPRSIPTNGRHRGVKPRQ